MYDLFSDFGFDLSFGFDLYWIQRKYRFVEGDVVFSKLMFLKGKEFCGIEEFVFLGKLKVLNIYSILKIVCF